MVLLLSPSLLKGESEGAEPNLPTNLFNKTNALRQKSFCSICHSGLDKPAPYLIQGNPGDLVQTGTQFLSCIFPYPGCFEIPSYFHFRQRSHDKKHPDTQFLMASTFLPLPIFHHSVECCGLTPSLEVQENEEDRGASSIPAEDTPQNDRHLPEGS